MASVSVRVDFFRFGCELVDWVFNVYVFKLFRSMGGARDAAAVRSGRWRRPPLTIRIVIDTLCFIYVYAVFV